MHSVGKPSGTQRGDMKTPQKWGLDEMEIVKPFVFAMSFFPTHLGSKLSLCWPSVQPQRPTHTQNERRVLRTYEGQSYQAQSHRAQSYRVWS
jgi:hypothetical protein